MREVLKDKEMMAMREEIRPDFGTTCTEQSDSVAGAKPFDDAFKTEVVRLKE